ncbi:hypothetical protein C7B65_06465 [Phormidesmis priestleyi ULC007]|uniref:Uncharacterized protein n=1 Tax=Phormidesmis priestleyi ULC007 TaxID=1920490 RepID=A0A2T1DJD2_9CYAN|nr:hypothetical protein [Phormidesmis priestleyi]PSB20544.1 hypothetical protein C7B65_06465 [Phormidesmis priestleyi ULC007]PZO54214.1 MAG: hypothetical protein DCF14_02110 [Phormidesmis priestleyi]
MSFDAWHSLFIPEHLMNPENTEQQITDLFRQLLPERQKVLIKELPMPPLTPEEMEEQILELFKHLPLGRALSLLDLLDERLDAAKAG